jgi:hypothetical protein
MITMLKIPFVNYYMSFGYSDSGNRYCEENFFVEN